MSRGARAPRLSIQRHELVEEGVRHREVETITA